MKFCIAIPLTLAGLTLFAAVPHAAAQPFSIDRFVIAGGGGTSSGGSLAVSGTSGQAEATPQPLAGGGFSLIGGFWSFGDFVPPVAPLLSIERQDMSVRVFWSAPATDFVLDHSLTPAGEWSQVSFPYSTNGGAISIVVPAPTGNKFYRLRKL